MTDAYIFGYGSLIWKVDFPYESKSVGFVRGFSRRFWQLSEDHRGEPGKPGRVVMLVRSEDPEEKVWGAMFKIPDEEVKKTKKQLDNRETGYVRAVTSFYPKDESDPVQVQVFVANSDNPFYAGPASLGVMAKQIFSASGLSGTNLEYLENLVNALREITDEPDGHLSCLNDAIQQFKGQEDDQSSGSDGLMSRSDSFASRSDSMGSMSESEIDGPDQSHQEPDLDNKETLTLFNSLSMIQLVTSYGESQPLGQLTNDQLKKLGFTHLGCQNMLNSNSAGNSVY